jgi:glucokinase
VSDDPLLSGGEPPTPPPRTVTGILLGIDIGGTNVSVGTADQDGRPLRSTRIPTDAQDGADAMLPRVLAAARDLAAGSVGDWDVPLVAVGLVCPGIVRSEGVLLSPNAPGWGAVQLAAAARTAFPGVPVAIMNDVKAAALAEVAHGALADVHCGIYVNLGTGIAAAIVLDGEVVNGANGAAGEIGYQIPDAGAPLAHADGHAPLEEAVSGKAIAARVSAVLGRTVSVPEAFALAAADHRVREVVDSALDLLATHVANLAVAVDPQRIVIGGGLVRQADVILPRLVAAVRRVVPFPPQVVVAASPDDAALAGALELAARTAAGGSANGSVIALLPNTPQPA